jgi:DNA repair exonuclease SbcCD ATPase subunit
MAGGVVKDLPNQPVADWPSATPPQIFIPTDGGPKDLVTLLEQEQVLLNQIEQEEIPRVEQVAQELTTALAQAQRELAETEIAADRLVEEVENERSQLAALDERLEALKEDLQKNRDIERLRELGSKTQLSLWEGSCPTCHQSVTDSLFEHSPQPMSVADNIVLIQEQGRTFTAMHSDAQRVLATKERRLEFLRQKLDELRSLIRTQKRSLASDARAPSEAAIQARLQLEGRVRQLRRAVQETERVSRQLGDLAARWRELQERNKAVSKTEISTTDERKLQLLQSLLIEQLKAYGFSSMPPDSLRISKMTYRPEHEGFDLGFDLSASDMIRTIWAYIHGLLEVSRTEQTSHPGLLILDEPRQQETARVDFASFLKRASSAEKAGQQVIFATSEEPEHLRSVLSGLPHTYISFEGRILKRMEAAS